MRVYVRKATKVAHKAAKSLVAPQSVCYTEDKEKGGRTVNTVFDVAKWFLDKESMTQKKLQKLCYYAQAWSYVLLPAGKLEEAPFEAWVHGPVNRMLWEHFRDYGYHEIYAKDLSDVAHPIADSEVLSFLEDVYATYGKFSGYQLENLTHTEEPWKNARKGYGEFQPSAKQIEPSDMLSYYGGLISQPGVGE